MKTHGNTWETGEKPLETQYEVVILGLPYKEPFTELANRETPPKWLQTSNAPMGT